MNYSIQNDPRSNWRLMFPLFMNLKGKKVLVVGAGPVGMRRIEKLLAANARIRMVCTEPPQTPVSDGVEVQIEPYNSSHLDGIRMALAAAPEEVNRAVVRDAKARGIPVNSASDPDESDFHIPATICKGPLTIAISSGGLAPGVSRVVRQHLETTLDDAFGEWVALAGFFRPSILQMPKQQQQPLLEQLHNPEWIDRLRKEGFESVKNAMQTMIDDCCF